MRSALIGHTGFLGGNLARQFPFDELYHSKDIGGIRGREFGCLVCAGVSAMKWWANQNAAEDRARIDSLLADLASVRARRVFVISTVDVYPVSAGVDENFDCHASPNHAYGANRLYFEEAMQARFPHAAVVRIGGVFGPGLKKNVIYDLLHGNCLDMINPESRFQYYDVSRLWRDLLQVEQAGIRLINFVSEPITTRDIIDRCFPGRIVGAHAAPSAMYDVRTIHSRQFGGPDGYLTTAGQTMRGLGELAA